MKKVILLVVVLCLLLSTTLLIGCDDAMLEEILEAQGFDAARWEELEKEMETIEAYAEKLKQVLSEEDRMAFEENLKRKMEEKFGSLEKDMEERMAAIQPGIEQQLENEEINEVEALDLMMEAMAGIFIEMLQVMEEVVPYMREALEELVKEFDIDVTAIKEIIPGTVMIVMTISEPLAKVNEQVHTLDQAPVILEGRTLVPLRFIGEALGASVEWNPDNKTITYTTPDTQILLTIDKPIAYVNGLLVEIEVAPTIINKRTLVPVRFVSESMGFQTDWLPNTRQVIVTNGKI